MRRLLAVLIAALAMLALVGCGGGDDSGGRSTAPTTATSTPAPPATAPTGDAKATVIAAYERLQDDSYRGKVTTTTTVDDSGAPAAVRARVPDEPMRQTARSEAETGKRVRATVMVPGASRELTIVLYDGDTFATADGTDFKRLTGPIGALYKQITGQSAEAVDAALVSVRDDGSVTEGGAELRKYTGAVDPDFLAESVTSAFSGLGISASAFDFGDASIEIYVDASGRIVRQVSNTAATLDLGELQADLSGSLGIDSVSDLRVSDHGADITIPRPAASGDISTAAELGQLLIG